MPARKITIASLTFIGLCVSFCRPAQAQPAPGAYQPPPAEPAQPGQSDQPPPAQAQPYPGQPYQPQPYQVQPYPGQPYQPQPYQPQPYQPQPYQPQPYQPQPYQVQPYPGQPYQPQPYQVQPYPGQPNPQVQPYAPAQPYPGTPPAFTPTQRSVRYVNRPRTRLIIGGAVTLGVSWGLTSLLASSYSDSLYSYDVYAHPNSITSSGNSFGYASELWPLYIPVFGPWIEMGYLHGSGSQLGGTLLAFDGLVQAGGLALIIAGAVTHTRVAIYARNNLQISPLTLNGGSGILVGGRF